MRKPSIQEKKENKKGLRDQQAKLLSGRTEFNKKECQKITN